MLSSFPPSKRKACKFQFNLETINEEIIISLTSFFFTIFSQSVFLEAARLKVRTERAI